MNLPDDLAAWRKARRLELIATRAAMSQEARTALQAAIEGHLQQIKAAFRGLVIGFCWPYRGEPDLTVLVQSWVEDGLVAVLPALAESQVAMRFRRWSRDVAMTSGAHGIPIPARTEVLVPDLILVPMVGYDDRGYRLGYGGGYFDRMMAGLAPAPITIGIAAEAARLDSIFPQAHDICMDCVVTEAGFQVVEADGLRRLDPKAAVLHLNGLARARCLPRVQNSALDPPRIELSSPVCYASEFPGYFGDDAQEKSK